MMELDGTDKLLKRMIKKEERKDQRINELVLDLLRKEKKISRMTSAIEMILKRDDLTDVQINILRYALKKDEDDA